MRRVKHLAFLVLFIASFCSQKLNFVDTSFKAVAQTDIIAIPLSIPDYELPADEKDVVYETTASEITLVDDNIAASYIIPALPCTAAQGYRDIKASIDHAFYFCAKNSVFWFERKYEPTKPSYLTPFTLKLRHDVFPSIEGTASKCYTSHYSDIDGLLYILCLVEITKIPALTSNALFRFDQKTGRSTQQTITVANTDEYSQSTVLMHLKLLIGAVEIPHFIAWNRPTYSDILATDRNTLKKTSNFISHWTNGDAPTDNKVTIVKFDKSTGAGDYEIITDYHQVDSNTAIIIGFVTGVINAKISVIDYQKNMIPKQSKQFELLALKKGTGRIVSAGSEIKLIYSNIGDNKVVVCSFTIASGINEKSCVNSAIPNGFSSIDIGACNLLGCFATLNSLEAPYNILGTYLIEFNAPATRNFIIKRAMAQPPLFFLDIISFISPEGQLLTANSYKSTLLKLSPTTIGTSGKSLMVTRKQLPTATSSHTFEVKTVVPLFKALPGSSIGMKHFYYNNLDFELYIERKSGNGLTYSMEPSQTVTYAGVLQITFAFPPPGNAVTIVYGRYAFNYLGAGKLDTFTCIKALSIPPSLECALLKELDIAEDDTPLIEAIDQLGVAVLFRFKDLAKAQSSLVIIDENTASKYSLPVRALDFKIMRFDGGYLLFIIVSTSTGSELVSYSIKLKEVKELSKTSNFGGGIIKCLQSIQLDGSGRIVLLEKCGKGDAAYYRLDATNGLALNIKEARYSQNSAVIGIDKEKMLLCVRGEEMLVAEKEGTLAFITRFDSDSFKQDLGFTQLKITKIHTVFCPRFENEALIFASTQDNKSLVVAVKWRAFETPEARIVSIDDSAAAGSVITQAYFGYFERSAVISFTEKNPILIAALKNTHRYLKLDDPVFYSKGAASFQQKIKVASAGLITSIETVTVDIELVDFVTTIKTTPIKKTGVSQGYIHFVRDYVRIEGPVFNAAISGDANITKNYQIVTPLSFVKDYEETGTTSLEYFKEVRAEKGYMIALADIKEVSHFFMYNNLVNYEQEFTLNNICQRFDIDLSADKTSIVILASCLGSSGNSNQFIIVKKMSKFDPSQEVYKISKENKITDLQFWRGKDNNNFFCVLWEQNTRILQVNSLDLTTSTIEFGKAIKLLDYKPLETINDGNLCINV